MQDKKMARIGALLVGLGSLVVLGASRLTWISVGVFDDKSGHTDIDLTGAVWSTEITALGLVLLAGAAAGLALRRSGRRIIGLLTALTAVGASWTPLVLLAGTPDAQRAHALLSSGAVSQRANDPVTISAWAEIESMDVSVAGPILAMVGCAIALVGAVFLVMKPGEDSVALNRFERQTARKKKVRDELESSPDSGRVMWDALDEDIDPTDFAHRGDTDRL